MGIHRRPLGFCISVSSQSAESIGYVRFVGTSATLDSRYPSRIQLRQCLKVKQMDRSIITFSHRPFLHTVALSDEHKYMSAHNTKMKTGRQIVWPRTLSEIASPPVQFSRFPFIISTTANDLHIRLNTKNYLKQITLPFRNVTNLYLIR